MKTGLFMTFIVYPLVIAGFVVLAKLWPVVLAVGLTAVIVGSAVVFSPSLYWGTTWRALVRSWVGRKARHDA